MILIKNGIVHTMDNDMIDVMDILIKDKKIVKINKNITENGAHVIDATGKNVYPGLIDAHSHLAIMEEINGYAGNDTNEMSDPITPEVRALDGINPFAEEVSVANAAGVTTVCVPPGSANVVGGQTVVFKTTGVCIDEMMLNPYVAMKAALGENPKRVYESSKIKTRMRTAHLLRKLLIETKEYMAKKENSKEPVPYNMQYEAMSAVINKEVDLKIHAHRADDIATAIRIAKEFDIKLTLDHCTEGHLIPQIVKDSNFPALVGPSLTSKTKFELSNKTFKTPAILHEYGVKIAIITDAPIIPQEYLGMCAGLAVKAGMDEYEALKAITINPAEILRLDHRIGSITVDKDADIIIVDGNILDSRAQVLYTITDGTITHQH